MRMQEIVVEKGDTLWTLAEKHLGSPYEWPRLFAFNNRSEIVKLTGKGIADPDLILAGQTLMIPRTRVDVIPGRKPLPRKEASNSSSTSLTDQLPHVTAPFSVKYSLDDLPLLETRAPGFKATMKMAGDIVIELPHAVPLASVSNRAMEVNYKQQTKTAFQDLISDSKIAWNRRTKQITYSSSLTLKSNEAGAPQTTVAVEMSSNSPVPVLKSEFVFPKLSGRIHGKPFLALDVKVVVELEPENNVRPSPVPLPAARPMPIETPSRDTVEEVTTWTIALGASIIVGTIVADFLTAGASIADDPVTIAAGLALMGIGVNNAPQPQTPTKTY